MFTVYFADQMDQEAQTRIEGMALLSAEAESAEWKESGRKLQFSSKRTRALIADDLEDLGFENYTDFVINRGF